MRRLLYALPLAALVACQQETPPAETPAPAAPVATAPAAQPPQRAHEFKPAIDAGDFARHVETLASDAFEGRAPGSAGERFTTTYLQSEFERIGIEPGNNGSFFQSVPMVETTADAGTTLSIAVGGATQTLAMGNDMVVGTRTGEPIVKVDASELVFVGYGVNAPEAGWNDYEGLDVKGKTVVVLVNDPGFLRKDPELFKGPAMTYYGRWTYKFEEAARQGAAGALIVHDTEPASYGWDVVRNSWSGAQFELPPSEDPSPRLQFEGWLTGEAATALFAAAGKDLAQLKQAADARGFKPIPLDAKLSLELKSTTRSKSSDNVVGLLRGASKPDEAIVYMAHWDHLGKHEDEPGDNIYNGAIDNATGVAGVLEIAEAFARQDPKPARSVVFFLPTLEESGLLGSKYYAAHPPIPLEKTIAAINMDAMSVAGRTRDVAVIGHGQSELEDLLTEALKGQDRVIVPEPSPERGYYFRSDHFNFAKQGVPSLYAKSGNDVREGGVTVGVAATDSYTKDRYHKPGDEYDPATWKLDGTIEDVTALYEVGKRIATGDIAPTWRADSEFAAARKPKAP
ncbi:MAG TPA: M28 family metallopeptidase [Candidatus Saccharimonadia bacterium]|nr:M28 family metallopeptidase [Candidatus Saccharimonadia bacterium]